MPPARRASSAASSRPGVVHLGNDLGAIRNYVAAPVRVRGDLLHRRLPRADEHPRPGRSCGGGRARWRPRCSPSASTRSAARCSCRATGPSTPSSPGCSTTVTPVSWLERTPTYKEKKQNQPDDVNHGLLTYPVLQAADIVIYKASLVPVGKDQAAHLELSREIVRAFNDRYGDTFPEPQAVYTEAPDRPRHRRRPEDEQVGRQHDRRSSRPSRRHPQAGHVDGHRHASGSCAPTRAGRRSATSASSTASSATTTRRSGTASGRPGPAASTRRSCSPSGSSPTTPRPASATSS